MSACMFLLIFLRISNLNTVLHFQLVSSYYFIFSPSVLELLIHKIFCLQINIFFYCIGPVSYIYQQISYTFKLNNISSFNFLSFMYFLHLLLLQHGDKERDSGPQSGQIKNFSCCHWNINSLVAQTLNLKYTIPFKNMILYKYLKYTLIDQFQKEIQVSNLMDIRQLGLIIQVIKQEEQFVFATKNL